MKNNIDINIYSAPVQIVSNIKKELAKLQDNDKAIQSISNQLKDLSVVLHKSKADEEHVHELLKNDFAQVMRSLDHFAFKLKKCQEKDYVFTLIAGKLASEIGLSEEKHINKSVHEIIPKKTLIKLIEPVEQTLKGTTTKFELKLFNKYLFVTLSPFFQNGEIKEIVGSVSDITSLKQSELIVENMAFHDSLTDLPNRRKLNQDLTRILLDAEENNESVAILSIDLDHFIH